MMTMAPMGLCLWTLGVVSNLAVVAEPPIHIIITNHSGQEISAQLPLSRDQLVGAKHLWVWSAGVPPAKLPPPSSSPAPAKLLADIQSSRWRWVDIGLKGWSRSEELTSLRIIAAPIEMFTTVPEPLLPSYEISKEGRAKIPVRDPVRFRIVGQGFGTMWREVPRGASSVEVGIQKNAMDIELRVRLKDGKQVKNVHAFLLTKRGTESIVEARFLSDDTGLLRIGSLPRAEVLTLFLTTKQSAPHTISGTVEELRRTIELPVPRVVRGRFIDESGEPLRDVVVDVEGWVSTEAPVASRSGAVSADNGAWAVENLPAAAVMVRATASGRTTFRKKISLAEGDVDLGILSLPRANTLLLKVSDSGGEALSEVEIKADTGLRALTSQDGKASLTGLPADGEVVLTLTANGFEKKRVQLVAPFPREEHISLNRAFAVKGRVVTQSGEAPADVQITRTTGLTSDRKNTSPEGLFSFDVPVGEEFELTFESPTAAPKVLRESAGQPGEFRDLGEIRLESGASVVGQVVDHSGAPVVGARVWAIRHITAGTIVAWASGRIAHTTSDASGRFELRGLTAGQKLVRFQASNLAPAFREVDVDFSEPRDIGTVQLVEGSPVTVRVNASEAVARLDLRGQGLEADMITAPVVDGEARLRHVPEGLHDVTVLRGNTIVCDRRITVSAGRESRLECPPPTIVRGRVLVGGVPAFEGVLTWTQPKQTDVLIERRLSPLGASDERVYGGGSGIVVVPVRSDGTFETDQLRSGQWQVAWRSLDGSGTPDRTFSIPDTAVAHIVVDFSGGSIRGRVVNRSGEAAVGARVREIQGTLSAVVKADGTFEVAAVSPGIHRLQAIHRGQVSRVQDVRVESGGSAAEVVLTIDGTEEDVLTIGVTNMEGSPQSNAFVFVELAGGGVKMTTANRNGLATTSVAEGLPQVSRLAAYAQGAWAFGEYRKIEPTERPKQANVRFLKTGSIRLLTKTTEGPVSLRTPSAPGDLAWMFSRVGSFLVAGPDSPLVITGLPPGLYELRVDSITRTAVVTADGSSTVNFP